MEQVRLFFSHSSKDDDFGKRLVADLRAHLGDDAVWYDAAGGLHGGEEWWNRIVAEITARDTFLVLLSPDALASDWVPREMSIAYWQHVKLGKRLLPLMYRICEMPPDWQLIQAPRFTDELSYDERLTTLLRDLGYKDAVTPHRETVTSTVTVPASLAARTEAPKERLVARLIHEVHTAFGRNDWRQVLLRARTLQDEAPEAMTPQLWRELGLAALSLGEGDAALAALNHALDIDPYDIPALRGKAQALVLLNQSINAVKLLERARGYTLLDETELQLALLVELLVLLAEQRRWDEVLAICEQALALNPSLMRALTYKGRALLALGRSIEAENSINHALALAPQDFVANKCRRMIYRTNHPEDRQAALEEPEEEALYDTPMDVLAWIAKGDSLTPVEALPAYEQALARDSQMALAWKRRKGALIELERFNARLNTANNDIARNPTAGYAWDERARALSNLNRFDEALASYDQEILLIPNNDDGRTGKARLLLRLNRSEEALAVYDEALARNPNATDLLVMKGDALARLERGDEALEYFNQALATYDQKIADHPEYSYLWMSKIDLLLKLKREVEAIATCDQHIAIDRKRIFFFTQKAEALFRLKRYRDALRVYDEALALEPDSIATKVSIWLDKSRIYWRQERNEEELKAYDQIIELKPDTNAWISKGDVLARMKRHEEALVAYDQMLMLTPDDSYVWRKKARVLKALGRSADAHDAELHACELEEPTFGEQPTFIWGFRRPTVVGPF